MKMLLVLVLALAAGCNDDDDGPESAAPGSCDLLVDSADECPTTQELCTPESCGGLECCYWDPARGYWMNLITDCFDGCPGNVDAAVDAPMDGCQPGGDAQASSALPHC